jgi:hypothetical protein
MSYGLLTAKDIETIEKTLDLVCESNYNDPVRVTEIGVRDGSTSRGINKYLVKKGKLVFYTGIDNNHDMEVQEPFDGCYLIIGNHSLFNTTADFLLYMSKVRVNGFFVFHDTSPNIAPFTDYQGIGDKNNTYNYISCRDAIQRMGLLENKFPGWELVYDEHDQSFPTGGVTVVKRIS